MTATGRPERDRTPHIVGRIAMARHCATPHLAVAEQYEMRQSEADPTRMKGRPALRTQPDLAAARAFTANSAQHCRTGSADPLASA